VELSPSYEAAAKEKGAREEPAMQEKGPQIRRVYTYLVIVGVAISYALILLAISLAPWFSWFNNALSDLGNTALSRSSNSAPVFNSGLVLGGALVFAFSVLLAREAGFSWKYVVWSVPLSLASADLALIGVFNESFGEIHLIVSVVFFFLTALTLLLFSYVSFPLGLPRVGAISLMLGVFCSAMWVARFPWQGVAIQEASTSIASAAFVVIISIVLRFPKLRAAGGVENS